jgi:hypothetical protein
MASEYTPGKQNADGVVACHELAPVVELQSYVCPVAAIRSATFSKISGLPLHRTVDVT